MAKYWFDKDNPEMCHALSFHKQDMIDLEEEERTLIGAKAIMGQGLFWCHELDESGDVADGGCGKSCEFYKPRNGTSGRCSHSGHCYDITDEIKILKR